MMAKYSIEDPRASLPPGRYYIGDPCYVIKDEEWSDALEGTHYFGLFASGEAATNRAYNDKHLMNGVFSYHIDTGIEDSKSYLLAASSTEYGDGSYNCYDGGCYLGECGVDAGLIAAIPAEMIEEYGTESGLELGVVHEFKRPFTVGYSDGIISFGDVQVNTGDEDDEY